MEGVETAMPSARRMWCAASVDSGLSWWVPGEPALWSTEAGFPMGLAERKLCPEMENRASPGKGAGFFVWQ
jgi:hypothetical protein